MGFWSDLTIGEIWDDTVAYFSGSEDEAAAAIDQETREAEATQRQTAAPVGSGGTMTYGMAVPGWAWIAGGGVLALLAFRAFK